MRVVLTDLSGERTPGEFASEYAATRMASVSTRQTAVNSQKQFFV
jgi:hypothetical protein